MKFKLFSVVVGREACVASCPFCVSGCTPTKENLISPKVNFRNFDIACRLAEKSGIDTVMLTGRGEPLLYPDQLTDYLKALSKFNFPFIELQTNCILASKQREKYDDYFKKWYELGLTTITISVVSHRKEVNQKIYQPNGEYIDLPELIDYLHYIGFSLRLTCVMCKGMMDSEEEIMNFIKFAKENKVEQVTLRPVNDEFRRQTAHDWIEINKLTQSRKEEIKAYLDKVGTKLLTLERIGTVYDVMGQNVMFSLPLNKNTRDDDPENGRQLIFFPDGHLRYEWEMEGGILL